MIRPRNAARSGTLAESTSNGRIVATPHCRTGCLDQRRSAYRGAAVDVRPSTRRANLATCDHMVTYSPAVANPPRRGWISPVEEALRYCYRAVMKLPNTYSATALPAVWPPPGRSGSESRRRARRRCWPRAARSPSDPASAWRCPTCRSPAPRSGRWHRQRWSGLAAAPGGDCVDAVIAIGAACWTCVNVGAPRQLRGGADQRAPLCRGRAPPEARARTRATELRSAARAPLGSAVCGLVGAREHVRRGRLTA